MQQDTSPVSCEADSFFAAQGVGAFNMKGNYFRTSYNSFHISQNCSAPISTAIAGDCLVSKPFIDNRIRWKVWVTRALLLDLTPWANVFLPWSNSLQVKILFSPPASAVHAIPYNNPFFLKSQYKKIDFHPTPKEDVPWICILFFGCGSAPATQVFWATGGRNTGFMQVNKLFSHRAISSG